VRRRTVTLGVISVVTTMIVAIVLISSIPAADVHVGFNTNRHVWATSAHDTVCPCTTTIYTDTGYVHGRFTDALFYFDYVAADTSLLHMMANDSVTVEVEGYTARNDPYRGGAATEVFADTLDDWEDFYTHVDLVWAKAAPADTLYGPYYWGLIRVIRWHTSDSDSFCTDFTTDSVKAEFSMDLWDAPR